MADDFEPDDFEADPGEVSKLSRKGGVQRLELKKTAPDLSETYEAPAADENPLGFLAPKSQLGAAAHGVTQGATLGFGDELMSLFAADSDAKERMAKAVADVDAAKARGTYDPGAASPAEMEELRTEQAMPRGIDDYRRNRADFRGDLKSARDEHPKTFLAGEIGGGFALPVPGTSAKGLAKIGQYAQTGAKLGAIGAVGHSGADATSGDVSQYLDLLKDTGVGAGGGAIIGGALGAVASKVDPWLAGMAERRAFKALDPYMKTMAPLLRTKLGREPSNEEVMAEIQRLGRVALDSGSIPEGKLGRWATSEGISKAAAGKRDEAGQMLGGYISHLDDTGAAMPVSMEEIARSMEARALQLAKDPSSLQVARRLMREAEEMRQSGVVRALGGENPEALSLQAAEQLKRGMQGGVYGVAAAQKGGPTQRAKEIAASLARQASEDAIERSSGPDELAVFKALKDKYGGLDKIADISGYGAARNFRNNVVGLGDQQLAKIGAEMGGQPLDKGISAAALALANKIARERGSAAAARTLDNMSRSRDALGGALQPYLQLLEDEPK